MQDVFPGPSKDKRTKFDDKDISGGTKGISKIYNLGERGSGFRVRGQVQDYHAIREECLRTKTLWEDPEFPANDKSLFYSKTPNKVFEWKRPTELVRNAKLFVDGYSRFDVSQGDLNDCWLLAAIANITMHKDLFLHVVPKDQSFSEKYVGVFHFRFWQYGRWIDVVIDDRLPTHRGQLVYVHSTEQNEFWSALLEKAYAKLHGSYEALKDGTISEALEDFSGGLTETYYLEKFPFTLTQIMLKAYERSSLMGCSIDQNPEIPQEETHEGLIKGHAYSVTAVKVINKRDRSAVPKTVNVTELLLSDLVLLIRLHNTWGNEIEWNGSWSDGSYEWLALSDREKKELGLTFEADGEFWMSFLDFSSRFSELHICHLTPLGTQELFGGRKKTWETYLFEGEWVKGVSAGGSIDFPDTFCQNPQYRITVTEIDENDDEKLCTLIVALMQKNTKAHRKMGENNRLIGFNIFHLRNPARAPKPLDAKSFENIECVVQSPFKAFREVSGRYKLPLGTYCIIPSIIFPDQEAEFILRVFAEKKGQMEENDEKICLKEIDKRIQPKTETELHTIKDLFTKLAGDDMEIDWVGLSEILEFGMKNESQNVKFSKDVCRSMVAMVDVNLSGKLDFEEFKILWTDICNWQAVFKLYDKEGTNKLNASQLRQALNSAGYKLNSRALNALMHRYGTRDGYVPFEDFITCSVKLKTMIDLFLEHDPYKTREAVFTLDDWIHRIVYS